MVQTSKTSNPTFYLLRKYTDIALKNCCNLLKTLFCIWCHGFRRFRVPSFSYYRLLYVGNNWKHNCREHLTWFSSVCDMDWYSISYLLVNWALKTLSLLWITSVSPYVNSCKILTLTALSSPFWTTFEQEALQQASILAAIPKPGEFIFQGLIPVEVLGLVLMWIAFGLTFVSANNTHYVLANCWPDKPPLMGFFSNSGLWERKGHITILVLLCTLVHSSPCFCNVAFIVLTGNHF